VREAEEKRGKGISIENFSFLFHLFILKDIPSLTAFQALFTIQEGL